MTERIKLDVYVDLDPTPGPMHSVESAQNIVRGVLIGAMPHYKPMVSTNGYVSPERDIDAINSELASLAWELGEALGYNPEQLENAFDNNEVLIDFRGNTFTL